MDMTHGVADRIILPLLQEIKDYAITMLNHNACIVNWNIGAQLLYGYDAEEVMGGSSDSFYFPADKHYQARERMLTQIEQIPRLEIESWQRKKDGSSFYANVIYTSLHDEDGVLKGFARVVKDISQQRSTDEQSEIFKRMLEENVAQRTRELTVVNQELEAFSYSVSHDLRSPLRAIQGFTQIILEDHCDGLNEEILRQLNIIQRNATMMSQLIDDLLKFSRMSRLELVTTCVDMENLAQSCIGSLLPLYEGVNYNISLGRLSDCRGDQNMLKQVWMNLIDNALKYTSQAAAPTITIGSEDRPDSIIYFVKDNGVGFDMKYAGKLFGVFQRLHTAEEFIGTGLGLALVKRIVTRNGGQVWADAKPLEGTTIFFQLPK